MKVKYLGFELSTEKKLINLEDFIEDNLVFDHKDILERKIFIDDSDENYYKGLILTIKDQRAYCKLNGNLHELEITVENLQESDQLIDFNFFVLHKKIGKGLYQFYYQSTSLSKFKAILKCKFLAYRAMVIQNEEDKGISEGKSQAKSRKEANKKYRDNLNVDLLVKKDSLAQLLQKCRKIKSFEVEFSTYDHIRKAGLPMPAHAKKVKQKVYFENETKVGELAISIANYINNENPESGTIMVLDEYGQEMPYKLMDTPDLFHEEEFDELVQRLNSVKVGSFSQSSIFQDMIDICNKSAILR